MGNWGYNPTYRSYNPIYNWEGALATFINDASLRIFEPRPPPKKQDSPRMSTIHWSCGRGGTEVGVVWNLAVAWFTGGSYYMYYHAIAIKSMSCSIYLPIYHRNLAFMQVNIPAPLSVWDIYLHFQLSVSWDPKFQHLQFVSSTKFGKQTP